MFLWTGAKILVFWCGNHRIFSILVFKPALPERVSFDHNKVAKDVPTELKFKG